MLFELDSRDIQRDRILGLTIEEILILEMWTIYNLSASEIGEILNVTPQTIRSIYIRATVKKQ